MEKNANYALVGLSTLILFIGLVIFMTFSFDRPFRGDLGLTSEPYQLVLDKIMK